MKRIVRQAALAAGFFAALSLAGQGPGKGQGQGRRMGGGPPGGPQSHGQAQARGNKPLNPGEPSMHGSGREAVKHLQNHPALAARMQEMLPPGTDVNAAAEGFKNFGQFVATAHVAKNLNIPFDQLKLKTTGPDAMPLGKAIQEFHPELSNDQVKEAVKAGKNEEQQIRRESEKKQREAKGAGES